MAELRFDLFAAATDEEATRYRVLDGLQRIQWAYGRSEVYPHLSELIRLHETLTRLTGAAASVREARTGPLREIDLEEGRLIYDESDNPPILAEELARWALPLMAELIEEGRALFEFVDEHSEMVAVGIVPAYQDEGYLMVPAEEQVRILRYAMSLYDQPDGRYRSLRTTDVGMAARSEPPVDVKRRLVEVHPDLPNPATYRVDTDLEFPLDATLLPVAKRKLLQYLALGGPDASA